MWIILHKELDLVMIEAFVITLPYEKYIKMAENVIASCKKHNIFCQKWEAFDGLGKNIKIPMNLKNQTHINLLKVQNYNLTFAEIACFLSHYSLWCHCVELNRPIIILEHDIEFIKTYSDHKYNNTIVYLGHEDRNILPHVSIYNHFYKFIRGAYAYSIDPMIAKNLVSHVIKEGICRPVDVTMRLDYFHIIQDNDTYVIHIGKESTMTNRIMYSEYNKLSQMIYD